jgi:hypothetical protein
MKLKYKCAEEPKNDLDVAEAAKHYIDELRAKVVPIEPRGKKPAIGLGWQKKAIAKSEDIEGYFGRYPDSNLGILLDNNITDVDLDCLEALRLADDFLPHTSAEFGRDSTQRSHRLYISSFINTKPFVDPINGMLLELRAGSGSQTVVPPSVHVSGEIICWHNRRYPIRDDVTTVDAIELQKCVARLASASLLLRHYPSKGSRQDFALSLAGGVLRAGWSQQETEHFIQVIANAAGDEELEKRVKAVGSTSQKISDGKDVTGWPRLSDILDERVVEKVCEWLDIDNTRLPKYKNTQQPQYEERDDGIYHLKRVKNEVVPKQLTNFKARIVADLVEDDGVDFSRVFEIEALLGSKEKRFKVKAAEFAKMSWMHEELGANAIIFAASGNNQHVRAAIQHFSEILEEKKIYKHTGWRHIDEKWTYLHAGGGITSEGEAENVKVTLPDSLTNYTLPPPPNGAQLKEAIKSSMEILEVAPLNITLPLFATIWRSVLGSCDFSLHLSGTTGVGKSELAALIQQHFGKAMHARQLPASWSSTENALERLAFHTKDAVMVVDDFVAGGTLYDRQKLNRKADRLLRAVGNHAGRSRMSRDTALRAPKPPQTLVISTGEYLPEGQSLRARFLNIEVGLQDVIWEKIGNCQKAARKGEYAKAMSGFLKYLASAYEEEKKTLEDRVEKYRDDVESANVHPRTVTAIANLLAGLDAFLDLAYYEIELFDEEECGELFEQWKSTLLEVGRDQEIHQSAADPVNRFFELVGSALSSGLAYVSLPNGEEEPFTNSAAWGWRGGFPRGSCIGWVDENNLYLDSPNTFSAISKITGVVPLPVTPTTLHKRLAEGGHLLSQENARKSYTVRKTLNSCRRNVLHLKADCVVESVDDIDDTDLVETP